MLSSVFVEGQIINSSNGKRSISLEAATIDQGDEFKRVRWATDEEMNMLCVQYYEKGTGAWMVPAPDAAVWPSWMEDDEPRDPFAWFALLAEPKDDEGYDLDDLVEQQDKRFQMITEHYAVSTKELVVSKKYPGYKDGRKSKKLREEGDRLEQALVAAGKYIALNLMLIPRDSEQESRLMGATSNTLDEVTDEDLPYALAKALDRLRAPLSVHDVEDDDDDPNKTIKKKSKGEGTAKAAAKTPAAKGSAKGGGSRGGPSTGGSLGEQTVAQSKQVERAKSDRDKALARVRELEALLVQKVSKRMRRSTKYMASERRRGACKQKICVLLYGWPTWMTKSSKRSCSQFNFPT